MTLAHYPRITADMPDSVRQPAEARYRLAAGWLEPGELVVDAACGTGYGAAILGARHGIRYLGVDEDLEGQEVWSAPGRTFLEADLERWGGPAEPFDVAVVFETLEHLEDPTALRDWTYRARRLVLVSFPTFPDDNPFHVHQYRPGEVAGLWRNLRRLAYFEQPFEGTALWVFGQW